MSEESLGFGLLVGLKSNLKTSIQALAISNFHYIFRMKCNQLIAEKCDNDNDL